MRSPRPGNAFGGFLGLCWDGVGEDELLQLGMLGGQDIPRPHRCWFIKLVKKPEMLGGHTGHQPISCICTSHHRNGCGMRIWGRSNSSPRAKNHGMERNPLPDTHPNPHLSQTSGMSHFEHPDGRVVLSFLFANKLYSC